jgi:hypothetical protein
LTEEEGDDEGMLDYTPGVHGFATQHHKMQVTNSIAALYSVNYYHVFLINLNYPTSIFLPSLHPDL